jgi:hypothetical protein
MKKSLKQWIAFMLVLIMTFSDCMTNYAAETKTEEIQADMMESISLNQNEDEEVVQELPHVLFEMEELREQTTKQYRLSDGTILAAQYGMDVHYENEDGEWSEIDNRFLYKVAETEDDFSGYSTAEGKVEYKFAPQSGEGEIIRLTEGDYTVGFELMLSQEESSKTEQPMVTAEPKVTVIEETTVSLEVTEFAEVTVAAMETQEAPPSG